MSCPATSVWPRTHFCINRRHEPATFSKDEQTYTVTTPGVVPGPAASASDLGAGWKCGTSAPPQTRHSESALSPDPPAILLHLAN